MGGTSLDAGLLIHPADELVPGYQHPLADVQRGEVLPVQQVVGIGAGDAQHVGQLGGVEHKGQIAERIDNIVLGHGRFSSLAVQSFIQLIRYKVSFQVSLRHPPLLQILDDLDSHPLDEAAVHDDVLIAAVLGVQADVVLPGAEALEGGFVLHQRHHDLIVVSRALPADENEVAVLDARADHGVAPGAEQEKLAPAEERLRQADVFLDVLFRKLRDTAGHRTQKRHIEHVPQSLALPGGDAAVTVVVQHTVLPHVGQILGNRAHGEAHTRGDLADRGDGALPVAEAVDVVLDHGAILRFFVLHGNPPFFVNVCFRYQIYYSLLR